MIRIITKASLYIFLAFILIFGNINSVSAQQNATEIKTTPIKIVESPNTFINKTVIFKAKFDKFSAVGLDYAPTKKDSENYIGFTVQRDDITDHNIPLSEIKLFLKRDYAEKFAELDTGDTIEVKGKVFSLALGDPWIDVENITIIKKVEKTE
ncbi:MAG: hypothetical protein E7Z91_02090 [Cyanobacteria bacterium SIG30]|nr:hypothetical protein [Cyanobacteria bacterium SIG30]